MTALLRRWRGAVIGAVVSIAVIVFFITQIQLDDLAAALRAARLGPIAASAGLIGVGLALRALRWRALLDLPLPYLRAFHILNIAYFANAILPLRLGELARAYLASRGEPGIPPLRALSTVVVERLLDLLAVLILLGLALAFAPLPDVLRGSALFFIPVTAVGFGILIGLAANRAFTLRLTETIAARLKLNARLDLPRLVGHVLDGLTPLIRPRTLFSAIALTGAAWTFSVASGWVLMYAFWPTADLGATLLFTAAASFAVAVPAVPGNLGPYEGSVLVGLAAMGYGDPLAVATAFALTIHGLNLLINAALGGIGMFAEGVSLGQITRGVQALNAAPGP